MLCEQLVVCPCVVLDFLQTYFKFLTSLITAKVPNAIDDAQSDFGAC